MTYRRAVRLKADTAGSVGLEADTPDEGQHE